MHRMEKRPIVLNADLSFQDKFILLLLVILAPLGLLLLFSHKISLFRNVSIYPLLILSAAWINFGVWCLALGSTSIIFLVAVISSLPFAAYFFFLEERKFYAVKSTGVPPSYYLYAVTLPILTLQMIVMVLVRLVDANDFYDCSSYLKMAVAGTVFTVFSFCVAIKYFVENNYVLEKYFDYMPDNNVSTSMFSIVSLIAVVIVPFFIAEVPSVMVFIKCLLDG